VHLHQRRRVLESGFGKDNLDHGPGNAPAWTWMQPR
jgi:hypothetical protein